VSIVKNVSRPHTNRRRILLLAVTVFIIGLISTAFLLNLNEILGPEEQSPNPPIKLLSNYVGNEAFSAVLPEIIVKINASQYSLPVDLGKVNGYSQLKNWLDITLEQEDFLSKNGFVVLRVNKFDNLADFYECELGLGMPIMITTDAVFHTYHVLFDEILKRIEMGELIDELNVTINALLVKAQSEVETLTGTPLENASKLNLMYLEVAHALMQPNFTPTTDQAKTELQLISNHSEIWWSPIFEYKEDYTQYVPRGHYSENRKLESYFKTMIWLGRMRFAILKDSINNIVNVKQTRAAILLTWMVTGDKDVYAIWQRIYKVTKFFVGVSDDLTFKDYLDVLNEYEVSSLNQLYNVSLIKHIAQSLLEKNKAKILGTYASTYPWLPQGRELERILNETAGLRFMGQRFIPDSYIFQQLVYPKVGTWTFPRLMPKGLDIPAVFGSNLAKKILMKTEAKYENYTIQLEKLREELKALSVRNWTQNLYWSWLYTANTTLKEISPEENYPTFMKTSAWSYEKLQTFEGTWTELRHDTILYAKQSYTPVLSVPPSSTAYVEPYPETYRRLTGLINMTLNGLTSLQLLQSDVNASLRKFMRISELFLNASIIELEGKTLDQNMQKQIRQAAGQLVEILKITSEKTRSVTIIADVHTDPNYGKVLEEALGKLNVLIVVHADEDGKLYANAGPVYNYFEFTQPMDKRLTDEEWSEMFNSNPPEPLEWTDKFAK